MTKLPKIGYLRDPVPFQYEQVLRKGKPYHNDDWFAAKHPHMEYGRRAKICAPFAALKGFEEEVQSKDIRYEKQRELDPDGLNDLNETLNLLHELTINGRAAKQNHVQAEVEYFELCEDSHHEVYHRMGIYHKLVGTVRWVDGSAQKLRIDDTELPFQHLFRIRILSESETNRYTDDSNVV